MLPKATRPPKVLQSSIQPKASQQAITSRGTTFLPDFTPSQIDVDLSLKKCILLTKDWFPRNNTGFKRFPFDNFTYCLTLFSKFFSSFPHCTCSLSVSRQYLALDGIYHPFWTAFPNYPTLWKHITQKQTPDQIRDSHPLWCRVPTDLNPGCLRKCF